MGYGVVAALDGQLDAKLDSFLKSGLQEGDVTLVKEKKTMNLSKFFAKGELIPVICQDAVRRGFSRVRVKSCGTRAKPRAILFL